VECRCGETKDIEFYDSNKTKCKACIKKAVSDRRTKNIERVREYDRNRPNAKERVKQNQERMDRYKIENPEKYKQAQKQKLEWAKKNRLKRNAHLKLSRAILNGSVKRLYYCEHCNATEDIIQGHHPSYFKPLDVVWLCSACHGKEHKRLNEIERR